MKAEVDMLTVGPHKPWYATFRSLVWPRVSIVAFPDDPARQSVFQLNRRMSPITLCSPAQSPDHPLRHAARTSTRSLSSCAEVASALLAHILEVCGANHTGIEGVLRNAIRMYTPPGNASQLNVPW